MLCFAAARGAEACHRQMLTPFAYLRRRLRYASRRRLPCRHAAEYVRGMRLRHAAATMRRFERVSRYLPARARGGCAAAMALRYFTSASSYVCQPCCVMQRYDGVIKEEVQAERAAAACRRFSSR